MLGLLAGERLVPLLRVGGEDRGNFIGTEPEDSLFVREQEPEGQVVLRLERLREPHLLLLFPVEPIEVHDRLCHGRSHPLRCRGDLRGDVDVAFACRCRRNRRHNRRLPGFEDVASCFQLFLVGNGLGQAVENPGLEAVLLREGRQIRRELAGVEDFRPPRHLQVGGELPELHPPRPDSLIFEELFAPPVDLRLASQPVLPGLDLLLTCERQFRVPLAPVVGRCDGVVVAGRNRVELVVVAAGTRYRQAQHAAGDVEPVPRPAFAELRTGEQPLDDRRKGLRRLVGGEGIDFLGAGRQSRQIERHSPQPLLAGCRRHGREALRLVGRADEPVEFPRGPDGVPHRRPGMGRWGHERPELPPLLDVDRV